MPEFDGVNDFDRQKNGLVPVKAGTWEKFVLLISIGSVRFKNFFPAVGEKMAPLGVENCITSIARV